MNVTFCFWYDETNCNLFDNCSLSSNKLQLVSSYSRQKVLVVNFPKIYKININNIQIKLNDIKTKIYIIYIHFKENYSFISDNHDEGKNNFILLHKK